MKESIALQNLLQPHIPWHKARLSFCASFIVALIKTKTVNLTQVALALNPTALSESNYRRIQRFLADFSLDFTTVARLMLTLVPQKKDLIVTLDRTEWHFGKTPINILTLGIAYRGLAFPVLWRLLGKAGSSSTAERVALMKRFLHLVEPERIRALVADREFIGEEWLGFLTGERLPFVIRIRENARIGSSARAKAARQCFASLRVGHVQVLKKKRFVYGHKFFVVGLRLEGEFVLLVTNGRPRHALPLYGERWQIETLFAALKSRGFNFEETHLSCPERIERLMALLAIAFAWAYLVGDWLDSEVKPIRVKTHGRRARSVFRYGLDHLRSILLSIGAKLKEFFACLQVLSCT